MLIIIFNKSLKNLPTPINITFMWNYGSLLGMCLIIQVISGVFLSMHYTAHIDYSFFSMIHIMQDVNYGWFIRLIHMNGASMFFFFVYLHIGRGLYYSSYKLFYPWIMGVMIFMLMMMTSFMGYVLPWGQMSFWGATVITNLLSAIPEGDLIVKWIWGGFSVNNASLNRFYSFHFLMPFILIMFVFLHLMFLHFVGSSNPLGVNSNYYKINFHNYYTLKDLFGMFIMLLLFKMLIIYNPYILGDPENFIEANSMITPLHIQPEWYFLFAYTILRSIPNKLSGVIALLMSILILLILPFLYNYNFQSNYFYMFNQFIFWIFVFNFILLTWLGSQIIEYPFVELSQWLTVYYFFYYFFSYYLKLFIDKIMF
uniref:Cytochrome b n=1 Tax=Pselaphanus sp. QL-2013 TaxID=1421598 RepID=A0A0A6ZL43_9HYME|nr:cytochrome b [Pselaphanus sp. QL-2013]